MLYDLCAMIYAYIMFSVSVASVCTARLDLLLPCCIPNVCGDLYDTRLLRSIYITKRHGVDYKRIYIES